MAHEYPAYRPDGKYGRSPARQVTAIASFGLAVPDGGRFHDALSVEYRAGTKLFARIGVPCHTGGVETGGFLRCHRLPHVTDFSPLGEARGPKRWRDYHGTEPNSPLRMHGGWGASICARSRVVRCWMARPDAAATDRWCSWRWRRPPTSSGTHQRQPQLLANAYGADFPPLGVARGGVFSSSKSTHCGWALSLTDLGLSGRRTARPSPPCQHLERHLLRSSVKLQAVVESNSFDFLRGCLCQGRSEPNRPY